MSVERERALNLPDCVTATILVLVAIQCVMEWAPDVVGATMIELFSLIPARVAYALAPDATLAAVTAAPPEEGLDPNLLVLLNETVPAWLSLLSYAFLHANWTHLAVNGLSLAAFGSPVARRFGGRRFFAFLAVCAVAGAATHILLHPYELTPVIGASAAISGTMSAVARFVFAPGGLTEGFERRAQPQTRPAPRLGELATNRRALLFLGVWLFVNLLLGVFPQAGGVSGVIAWEAHIGGFLAGLILFPLFDPYRAAAETDNSSPPQDMF